MEMKYTMVIEPAEDGDGRYFGAYFPDLPGCTTMGRTLAELRSNAGDAVRLHLNALRETGQTIPKPNVSVETISIKAS